MSSAAMEMMPEPLPRLQLPELIECPFCPPGSKYLQGFSSYKQHCRHYHQAGGRCPACHQSFNNLLAHIWGRALNTSNVDPRHQVCLVSLFGTTGKAHNTRMRMHLLEREVFGDWERYLAIYRREIP